MARSVCAPVFSTLPGVKSVKTSSICVPKLKGPTSRAVFKIFGSPRRSIITSVKEDDTSVSLLYPVVELLTMLFVRTSIFDLWTVIPVAAVYKPLSITILLVGSFGRLKGYGHKPAFL
jgi:hypothetical protein